MTNRSVRKTDNVVPGAVVTLGCFYVLAIFTFWVAVGVVGFHFLSKFW